MATIFNIIIIFFMIYYTFVFSDLAFKTKRVTLQDKNKKLDKMRKIPVKTLEQQKKFIDMKYPKVKWKFTWKWLLKILIMLLIAFGLYRGYSLLLTYLKVQFNLWQVVLIVILFPLLVNLVLRLFHLEKDDLTVYFR